jgi:tRNA-splicing ligase RtcB
MSRGAAGRQFTVEGLQSLMDERGVACRVRNAIVDEHPGSYKEIDRVMEHARSLVRPTHVLRQIINVKGD